MIGWKMDKPNKKETETAVGSDNQSEEEITSGQGNQEASEESQPYPSTSHAVEVDNSEENSLTKSSRPAEVRYLCTSDERSSFLDEFDSDEYTFTYEDPQESILRNRIRELEKALKESERLRANQSAGPVSIPPVEQTQVPDHHNETSGDDSMFDNELDVASASEGPRNPIENAFSTSSAQEQNLHNLDVGTLPVGENQNATEILDNNLADDSDSDFTPSQSQKLDGSDSVCFEEDGWTCVQCKSKTLRPFRLCLRCFRIRRNWQPRRPKRGRKNKDKTTNVNQTSCVNENEERASQEPSSSNTCTLCYTRKKDAAFVHNKIAHHFACFTCADRILKQDGKCPICRERVLRVVKIISA